VSHDLWAARAHANGLGERRATTVAGAVGAVVALQGQDVRATRLAVRARTDGLTHAAVDAAVDRGDVVRTWAMRGTLHLVAAEDLRWLVRAVGPYFRDRQAPRRRQLGLDDAACARGVAELTSILTEPRTRAEIVERVSLDLPGQAAPYLLSFAALGGVLCRGPERGAEPTYVLVDDWVRGDRNDQLARRYLLGHGPATPADLAAWSGLPLTVARAAFAEIRDSLEPVGDRFVLADAPRGEATGLRLLGHFDALLLGYRERAIPPDQATAIQSGGGFIMPAVSVGGRVVGTWRLSTQDTVDVTAFTTITERLRRELVNEVADLGRFLDRKTRLGVVTTTPTD
jgi:winged helix DNA-binding protein